MLFASWLLFGLSAYLAEPHLAIDVPVAPQAAPVKESPCKCAEAPGTVNDILSSILGAATFLSIGFLLRQSGVRGTVEITIQTRSSPANTPHLVEIKFLNDYRRRAAPSEVEALQLVDSPPTQVIDLQRFRPAQLQLQLRMYFMNTTTATAHRAINQAWKDHMASLMQGIGAAEGMRDDEDDPDASTEFKTGLDAQAYVEFQFMSAVNRRLVGERLGFLQGFIDFGPSRLEQVIVTSWPYDDRT